MKMIDVVFSVCEDDPSLMVFEFGDYSFEWVPDSRTLVCRVPGEMPIIRNVRDLDYAIDVVNKILIDSSGI